MLVLLDVRNADARLQQLQSAWPRLRSADVVIIVAHEPIDRFFDAGKLPEAVITEGLQEIRETYAIFARSFSNDDGSNPSHVEYLIDKQGYIRARWLPAENEGWSNTDMLLQQINLLRKEVPRAPAPDEHVH